MEQRILSAEKLFREPALKEPSPRKQLGLLATQMAGLRKVTLAPEEFAATERALVAHARKMSEEVARER
jgi:hypothetical protein